ncbi:hypothetical protein KEM09_11275 [Carboxylicivirga mesophila]|uniref:Type IX secretion system membrane protein PorP/SprF n=1 Tax=Carboxylicivirga mesophila TaxID=1166478 RepID=A0ABS5KAI1_9BACT|nr:hypothetical protein [Carboxylicivirga mesophila]MBS2211990.1 hypothetical protein [Carboxylicivirga mesophila]
MINHISALLVLLMVCNGTFAQEHRDTVYSTTRLVPRLALNAQKGYGIEAGLFLNRFYTRYPRKPVMTALPYASSGFYLSTEMSFQDLNNLVIGPKVGWELSVIGETHGSYFGLEFINYTDFEQYSPALC